MPGNLKSATIAQSNALSKYPKPKNRRMSGKQQKVQNITRTAVQDLPNEMLARIFFFVTRNNDIDNPEYGSALRISAVCHSWRTLATSCPELWSNFTIHLGGNPLNWDTADTDDSDSGEDSSPSLRKSKNEYWTAQEFAVDLYLARSQSRLLTLDISVPELWGFDGDHPILSKLAQCSQRWQHVSLDLYLFLSRLYPSLCNLDLPALETIDVTVADEVEAGDLSLLSHAPKLHRLGVGFWGVTTTLTKILEQLTELTYSPNFENLYEMLDLCPNLRTLNISDFHSREDWAFSSNPPRRIPRVTSLSVSVLGYCMYPQYDLVQSSISSLTAPALTSLALEQKGGRLLKKKNQGRHVPSPFQALDSFLARSGCALTRLIIECLSLTDKEVVALLKRLPSLEEFLLRDPRDSGNRSLPITSTFLESLRVESHRKEDGSRARKSELLVPRLRLLTLQVESSGFDHCLFISMVLSRWLPYDARAPLGFSCLRSVELFLPERVDEADYLPLADPQIKNTGMRVVVKQCEHSDIDDLFPA